jgi:serine/threonine-protein kinase
VKLLDFGIAKLLNPGLAGVAAPVTRRGSLALTPEYASPEQLRGEALSTATDVYSLGVLLYRLLTGSPPYEVGDGSPTAVLAALLERDPVRPSVRVTRPHEEPLPGGGTRHATPQEIAADRRTTSGRLPRTLRGDLDAIVLKALRKEPGRRYGSAESLARDIQRYLRQEPVAAHKDSRGYRLSKLVRRHTFESVAAVLLVLSLLGGVAATGWQAAVAGRERDRAAEALERAEVALGQSEAVADFLMQLFWAGDPLVGDGEEVTARDLVRRGVGRADELSGQPVVQARMLDVLGQIQDHFGDFDGAAELLERAVSLRRTTLGPDHPDVATSLLNLARARRDMGRRDVAARLVDEALTIRTAAFPGPDVRVAEAVFEKGWLAPLTEQERLYREALEIHRKAGGDPGTEAWMLEVMSTNLRRRGKLEEAVSTARRAVELREAHFGRDHADMATSLYHLADHVRDLEGDLDEAERLYRRGIAVHTRAYGPNSLHLVHGLHSLGILLARRGNHAAAESLFRRLLEIRRSGSDPDNPVLARSMGYVATAVADQGGLDEAEEILREALAHGERTRGGSLDRHQNLSDLGWVLSLQGRWSEARAAFEDAFTLRLRVGGPDDIILHELYRRWGRILTRAGRHAEAEPHLLEARAGLGRVYAADHPNHVDARRALHELYTAWGKPDEATAYRVPAGVFHAY